MLNRLIKWFEDWYHGTIDRTLADFHNVIDRLERHVSVHLSRADRFSAVADAATNAAKVEASAADRAKAVSDKLKAIVA